MKELNLPLHWCRNVWGNATLRTQVCEVLKSLLEIDFTELNPPELLQINIAISNGLRIISINPLKGNNTLIITTQHNGETRVDTTYHCNPKGKLTALTKLIHSLHNDQPPISYAIYNIPEYLQQLKSCRI